MKLILLCIDPFPRLRSDSAQAELRQLYRRHDHTSQVIALELALTRPDNRRICPTMKWLKARAHIAFQSCFPSILSCKRILNSASRSHLPNPNPRMFLSRIRLHLPFSPEHAQSWSEAPKSCGTYKSVSTVSTVAAQVHVWLPFSKAML